MKEGENSTHVSHSTHVSLSTHVKDVTNSTADNIGKSAVYVSRYIRSTIVPLVKNDSMIETNVKDYVDISQVATIHMTRKNKLFRKKVNFDEIDNSILTLFNMIADLDPSTVREEHVDIKGKSKNFLLLPTLATHELAELQCNFLNSTLADLSLIDEEGIKVSRTIIVKDVIIKKKEQLICQSNFNYSIGLACIRNIYSMANSLNVHVNKDPKDLYNEILSNSNDVTYGIVIDQTNLFVTILDAEKGYALCLGTSEPEPDVQYRNLVQEKYFTHLSNICRNILKSFMKKSVQLQKAFLLTLNIKNSWAWVMNIARKPCVILLKN